MVGTHRFSPAKDRIDEAIDKNGKAELFDVISPNDFNLVAGFVDGHSLTHKMGFHLTDESSCPGIGVTVVHDLDSLDVRSSHFTSAI